MIGGCWRISLSRRILKERNTLLQGIVVNSYTHTQFLVTEEPFEDPDSNGASVIEGVKLVSPFGQ